MDRSAKVWRAIKATARSDGAPPTLLSAVRACAAALSAIGAGFAVARDDGIWEPLVASDPVAGELEELQFSLGEGPSGDAVLSGAPVLESDLAALGAGRRWPMFSAAATQRDIGAVFAFPVGVGAARVGVLAVYRRERGPLPVDLLQDALVYSDAVLVLALDDRTGVGTDPDGLITAAFTARRAEVHQATGMVAAQLGLTVTDALARLRAHAYSSGLSLQDVATGVMAGQLRLEIDATDHRTKGTGSQHADPEHEEEDS
nr:GAF and ANTAR domain-containing protein [Kribbella shirazensis]